MISKKFKGCFICCLPARVQAEVKREVVESLRLAGIEKAEIKELTAEAMSSRVSDLTEIIEIEFF